MFQVLMELSSQLNQHLVSYISIMHKAFIYTLYTYIYNRFCQREVNNLYSKI